MDEYSVLVTVPQGGVYGTVSVLAGRSVPYTLCADRDFTRLLVMDRQAYLKSWSGKYDGAATTLLDLLQSVSAFRTLRHREFVHLFMISCVIHYPRGTIVRRSVSEVSPAPSQTF